MYNKQEKKICQLQTQQETDGTLKSEFKEIYLQRV